MVGLNLSLAVKRGEKICFKFAEVLPCQIQVIFETREFQLELACHGWAVFLDKVCQGLSDNLAADLDILVLVLTRGSFRILGFRSF